MNVERKKERKKRKLKKNLRSNDKYGVINVEQLNLITTKTLHFSASYYTMLSTIGGLSEFGSVISKERSI